MTGAHLEGTSLAGAHLEGADLAGAHLEGTSLAFAHLEGADLTFAQIQGVDLRNVVFDQIALLDKNLLDRAEYDNETVFPDWLNPKQYGMQLVDETEDE